MNGLIEKYAQQARTDILDYEEQPFLICNWVRFVLIHYEIDPRKLQDEIPFELDCYENKAYVSLVAFTLEDFHFAQDGRFQRLLMGPVHTHRYFNVRTYVRNGNQKGIYFIKEWISNKLCTLIGANLYGLPCRHGQLDYDHEYKNGVLNGEVMDTTIDKFSYRYRLRCQLKCDINVVKNDTLEEFLFERYVAFIEKEGAKKYFRIWHEPWQQVELGIEQVSDQMLPGLGTWGKHLNLTKAHYAPGLNGVWMGHPQKVGY